jgi:arsenate reductase (glutaredoxin)
MSVVLYGIPNCDTVKKARTWLDARGVSHDFVDYKKTGADAGKLATWCDALSWEMVLNRAGTTFRKLPDADREGLNQARAIALMLAQPSMIKRPIVEFSGGVLCGFKSDQWASAFPA